MTLTYRSLACSKLNFPRGFKICRILALAHPDSCIAIHTVNPEVPAPRFGLSALLWLKYRIAKLTFAILRRSSFGYGPEDLVLQPPGHLSDMSISPNPGLTPPMSPGVSQPGFERPQTTAYALCDSPSGLLAYVLDAIRPPMNQSPPAGSSSHSPESLRPPTAGRSPVSPQSYGSGTPSGPSPQSPATPQTNLELSDLTPWTPTALINWAMLYWLPGPEVALRWYVYPHVWLSS